MVPGFWKKLDKELTGPAGPRWRDSGAVVAIMVAWKRLFRNNWINLNLLRKNIILNLLCYPRIGQPRYIALIHSCHWASVRFWELRIHPCRLESVPEIKQVRSVECVTVSFIFRFQPLLPRYSYEDIRYHSRCNQTGDTRLLTDCPTFFRILVPNTDRRAWILRSPFSELRKDINIRSKVSENYNFSL